jgi:hypothetical protein
VRRWGRPGRWLADPWRRPRLLEAFVWAYLAWSILPVTIAVWFSFNGGHGPRRLAAAGAAPRAAAAGPGDLRQRGAGLRRRDRRLRDRALPVGGCRQRADVGEDLQQRPLQPTPALNALATIVLGSSLLAVGLGALVYRRLTRGERRGQSAVEELAAQV